MQIKTKFNIGQIVWLIYGEKVVKGPIYSINIILSNYDQFETYIVTVDNISVSKHSNHLFDSKKSLINSIE